MKSVVAGISCLLLFLLPNPGSTQFLYPECGIPYETSSTRIIKGSVSSRTPWMALVFTLEGEFICGGTLISHQLILTAAHCLYPIKKLKATLGEYKRADASAPREDHLVIGSFKHRFYNNETFANDIAILRLASYVVYKDYIRPICIVRDTTWRQHIDRIGLLIATGWGTTETGEDSGDLMTLSIYKQHPGLCQQYIKVPEPLASNQFCAGNVDSNLCHGDSGGPVGAWINFNNSVRHIQIGIASYTNRRCQMASVFTDVLSHIDFIQSMWNVYGDRIVIP